MVRSMADVRLRWIPIPLQVFLALGSQEFMMHKDLILWTKEDEVYIKIGVGYMLHLAEVKLIEKMEAREIILLADLTVEEHTRQTVQ